MKWPNPLQYKKQLLAKYLQKIDYLYIIDDCPDMKTVYSNYSYKPLSDKASKTLTIVLFCLAVIFFTVYVFHSGKWLKPVAQILSYIFYWSAFFLLTRYSLKCEVDDEQRTLKVPSSEGNKPILIDNIDKITRHTSKKGKFRYLNIHEKGVRYAIIRLRESISDQLISELTTLNPSIKVKTVNYN